MDYKAVLEARESQPRDFFGELEQVEACYLTGGLHPDFLEVAVRYYGVNRDPQNMTRIAEEIGANQETVSLWLSITYYHMDKRGMG